MSRPRRAVVFDLDDTLLPEWQYVRSGYRAVARHLHGASPHAGETFGWLWARFLQGQHRDSFDTLLAEWPGGSVAELLQVYREHPPELRLAPGVRRALAELRARGAALAVISDGPLAAQTAKVRALDLEALTDLVLLTDSWGPEHWKPHPRAFRTVEAHFGLAGGQLTYVGDNLSKDFVAPARLGWHRVCLRLRGQVHARRRPPPGGEAELTLRSWRALHQHLLDWLDAAVPGG